MRKALKRNNYMLFKLTLLSLCLFTTFPAFAGDVTLTADKGVEYHQNEQKLVAVGNAVATKDNLSISAQTLIGYYNKKVKNKISRVEAFEQVHLSSPQAQAFGNELIYDLGSDTAVLTGNPAHIKTPDADITAKGRITYYPSQLKAVAEDGVIATDAKANKVFADLMTAYFTKDADGKMILNKIDIEKNVKIISEDAEVTALTGTYYALDEKIKLFDNVVINQNGNILKGSQAETDLNTGISKIISGGSSGRVSGVFKEKNKDQKE